MKARRALFRLCAAVLALSACAAPEARAPVAARVTAPDSPAVRVPAVETAIDDETSSANVRRPLAVPTSPDGRLVGPRRPPVSTIEIDYESLPILKKTESTRAPKVILGKDQVTVHGDLFAEVELGSFVAATDGPYLTVNAPACGPTESGSVAARWSGFEARSWRREEIRVLSAEGLFDKSTCEAHALRAGSVAAKAIVPGFVYAYREWAADDVMPGESLVVILPPADGLSITMSPDRSREASRTGSYTRVTLPVTRGSGRGFVAQLTPDSLETWRLLRLLSRTVSPRPDIVPKEAAIPLLLGVETTWEADERRAVLTLALPEGAEPKRYAALLSAASSSAKSGRSPPRPRRGFDL